jgi:hypothetical protein
LIGGCVPAAGWMLAWASPSATGLTATLDRPTPHPSARPIARVPNKATRPVLRSTTQTDDRECQGHERPDRGGKGRERPREVEADLRKIT